MMNLLGVVQFFGSIIFVVGKSPIDIMGAYFCVEKKAPYNL